MQRTATHCNTMQRQHIDLVRRWLRRKIQLEVQEKASFSSRGLREVLGFTFFQHAATYRNTLQHTATHCNTLSVGLCLFVRPLAFAVSLQHIAHSTLHNTLQHTATLCNTLQHTTIHYNTLQYAVTHCLKYFFFSRGLRKVMWGGFDY